MNAPRRLSGFVVSLLVLAGCGGGGGGASSSPPPVDDTNRAQAAVSIAWPSRGRSLPVSANSVRLTVLRNGVSLKTGLAIRPNDGSPSVVSFANLPIGTLDMRMDAYASADGSGTILATGMSTLTTALGTPTPTSIAPDLTPIVARLTLTPSSLGVPQNGTVDVTLTGADAAGDAVPIAASAVRWTSDLPSIATLSGSGSTVSVAGVAVGTTAIRATVTRADGSTLVASAVVNVTGTGGTVTVH